LFAIILKNTIKFKNFEFIMRKEFSLFKEIKKNTETLEKIDQCIKISIGPNGKNGIIEKNKSLKFITNGSLFLKSLEFENYSGNILKQLFEQAATRTQVIAGDGSTISILLSCELLKVSFRFLTSGYNSILLSNGLKKIAFFLMEKIIEFSQPIENIKNLSGILKTSIGKKINPEIFSLLNISLNQISRDGLIFVEENISTKNEIEIVQGIELEKGFASSYFINNMENFQVIYENPYLLIANRPINSFNQIYEILEFIKSNNRPLVIVTEEINKDVFSTLVLNNIQKKIKIVVIKYTAIKFMKTGILEDLSLLTHSNYLDTKLQLSKTDNFRIEDLGQVVKVIIKKDKSTFFVSKFSKLITARRMNELNRELLLSDSEYEKSTFKTRIARLAGNIVKIKIGVTNQYEITELKQKVENAIFTLKSSLEEGFLPGGGSFYLSLRDELSNWSYLNLIGEELFSSYIILEALIKPVQEIINNDGISSYPKIVSKLKQYGFPYGYNILEKKIVNTFENGLLDSTKAIRAGLWNAITIVSTLITSE